MTEETRPPIGVTNLEPGWIEGLAMSTYLGDPAVSASRLWELYQKTPAHLLHALTQKGDDTTPAKEAGTAVHAALYEPELFETGYVVIGQCEAAKADGTRCTNQGKVWRDGQSFCGVKGHDPYGPDVPMDPELVTMTAESRRRAEAMRGALLEHPTASQIVRAPGPKEVTGVWRDPVTGLWCRIRPDQLIQDPPEARVVYHHSVVNLKTSGKDIGEGSFPRDFHNMGHYFKAAFYRMGMRELWDIEPQNFLYPVVEQGAPHQVIVYRLNEDALDIGEAEVRQTLNELAECVESGRWHGYGPAIRDLNLPDWRLKQVHSIDFLEVA